MEWTYHSNAIEGNTLSSLKMKVILEDGLTVGGKRLQEHLEVINHAEAIGFVEKLVQKQVPLNEQVLKEIHYLLLKSIDNENAGTYRSVNVRIKESNHSPLTFNRFNEKLVA
ncbi:Fic family protein [Planococcus lenghuensis]|uniref:hypothetical protein n=1 Tax=Planococcus lenghuensis TaxID=2213202 RepID=UPI001E58978E|nr:hypothetical protein [Planococcus lenghuensis]